MEITRIIDGRPYTFELSEDELYQAYREKKDDLNIVKIMAYLDSVEQVGEIPSELLQSERFADKVLVQLDSIESDYAENISLAVSMAVDYEIKSNTLEDTVTANTADLIIGRLNNANYNFEGSSAQLAVTLKNQPDSVIRSLRQSVTVETVTNGQKAAMQNCISTVEKYKGITYVGRSINEREDYDDNDYGKELRKEREATGYDRYQKELEQKRQEELLRQQQQEQEVIDDTLDLTKGIFLGRKR